MPRIAPFRGLHYAIERFASDDGPVADVSDVVCPPYDVISSSDQADLLARHDYNAVRVELSAEPDPHRSAADVLAAWQADGTLTRRAEPTIYRYRHALPAAPDTLSVRGLVARVLLEPWGSGIRPHEHTMPGPKADRLALLRATRTQLSPILAVYFDGSPDAVQLLDQPGTDAWQARDRDGLLHELAALDPDASLVEHLARQTLFVADGHHRYETALAYEAEVRADPRRTDAPLGDLGVDWIMIAMVDARSEELEIKATHRLILDADSDALRSLLVPDPLLEAIPVAPADLPTALDARRAAEMPVFGLVLSGGDGYLLVADPDGIADRMRREPMSPAARELDLAVLHAVVLGDRLGITEADVAAGQRLAYTRSEADAIGRVARGEAAAAILVRPTRLDQLAAVASAGDVMPQKSTYFYPKLLTGLVFNPLED